MEIIGKTNEIFPTCIYVGEISQEVHDKTITKLADIEWGTVPLSGKEHGMNVSKRYNEPDFNGDVIGEYELDELHDEIVQHINQYCSDMQAKVNIGFRTSWITKYERGQFARQHSHGSASLSMAYYIASNEKDGNFYFVRQGPQKHTALTEYLPSMVSIPPAERKIILFPSWLEHGVEQNHTDSIRKCMSANFYSDYRMS